VSTVTIPEDIAVALPEFSGFARYETGIRYSGNQTVTLEITDAGEAVEVFVNGKSLGIQIAPPFRYRLTDAVVEGENKLVIEVATTLERQTYPMLSGYRKMLAVKPESGTGLTGTVKLITK
jgi:hypothetical protein